MPAVEDLLREEFTRVAETVQPGQLRPLRLPAPGRIWRRRMLPLAAAAAVTAAAVVAALLVGAPSGQQGFATPPPGPAAMPRYYVTVAKTSTGLEAVVRNSARGSVTGAVPLPDTFGAAAQSVAAAADGRTFVIAVNFSDASTLPGTVAIMYFRLPVSAAGRPGWPAELAQGTGYADPLMGMALSPDGTKLALSLKDEAMLAPGVKPYGVVEVIDLATGTSRTWTGSSGPGYWPGAPTWGNDGSTLAFTWWHGTSLATGAVVIAGTGELDTSAPGDNLLQSRLTLFATAIQGVQSAVITAGGRDIIASSCRGIANSGRYHDTAVARIVELSAADGRLVRELRTQTTSFSSADDEQNALYLACSVLSVDPSGQHVLVQAFDFGRIDNGVFTALPGGAAPPGVPFAAAAW
jgi:hypothetical protein